MNSYYTPKKEKGFLIIPHGIYFQASAAVMENVGTFKVLVCRHGLLTSTVRVRVETIDGSAIEGEDFKAVNEILTFEPGEREKLVKDE